MRKSHTLWSRLALAVLALVLAPAAHAQYPGYVTNSNDTGLPSYGSFISSSVDTVNLGTGGVSIRIPIASNTGRGSSYTFFLQYESKFWSLIPTVYPSVGNGPFVYYAWSPDQSAMWQTKDTHSIGYIGWTETTYTCAEPPQGGGAGAEIVYEYGPATVLIRSNYVYVAPDGSKHQLPLRNNYPMNFPGYCPDLTAGELPTNLVAQTDNDQVKVDITNDQVNNHSGIVITLANGTHTSTAGEVDSNGNICCIAGRPTYTGDPATTLYHQVYDVVDSNGVTQKVIVDYENLSVSTAFPTTTYDPSHFVSQYSGLLVTVVSKITLANGLAYTFSYDPTFGEISQINLPTGGYVKYQWTTLPLADLGPNDPISAVSYQPQIDARRISQRIVSEDGTAGSEKVWHYAYPSINGYYTQGTTVTDPLGNSENHGFATCGVAGFTDPTPQPSVDLGVSYYDPSGKLLKTAINNWQCDKGALYVAYPTRNLPFTYSALTEGIRNSRQTGTVTTLADTNQVSATQSDFNDCYGYTVLTQSYTDCRPNPTETREYDYGTGAPGTLLRTTDFTYLHNPNLNNASNNYLNAHIWDRVLVKSVYAGSSSSGTLASQTQYGYDSTAITSVTGAANHDDTDYPYTNTLRGNVTTVGRLLTSSSTWLTTTNYYNSVGNLVQTTDPGGHSYYLSYADNYSDSSKNGLSQAFLTSVTSPTTSNGVPHVEGKQYYWYSGLTAAVCGQNAPTPNVCSNLQGLPASDYARYTYDLMGRPAKVTHGDGGVTNFTFQETSFPFSVSSSSAIDSSQNLVNTALIDGLGRVTQTQLNSDPEGVDKVDTTYDPAGQKSTVSNPYRSPSDPTYGITTYQYDALGRTKLVIPPDGTTTSNNVSTIYSGNTVTVTDQAGKQRRSVTDALGRLIEVDEPSAPAGATVSNGYATISGTERWGGGASAVGWVTISGQEEGYTPTSQCTLYDCGGNCIQWGSSGGTVYDNGSVSISVNGDTKIVGYGIASTPYNIAWALMEAINADSSYPVTAGFNGNTNTVTLLAKAHGNNYSLYATSQTYDTSGNIWTPSFSAAASGTALTGAVADWADTGTITLTVGGVVNSVTYNASSANTTLASALAAAVNSNSSSLVTASATGTTINFTDKTQGTALGLSVGIVTNYPTVFAPTSFLSAVSDEYLNNFATAPPGSLLTPMVTLYTYNALDDLTCVEQHGTATGQTGCSSAPSSDSSSAWRIRRFQYDSLGRLTSATNPESGAISYTYDADGNVLTKYDARGITTTMTYDQLHRVLSKTYSDGVTPSMYFTYDMPPAWGLSNAANLVGRLVEARNQCAGSNGCGTSTVNSYDSRGRVSWQWQQTPALAPGGDTVTYSYNFAGNVTSENTWPGITFNSQIDPAGRVIQFTSTYVDATHPATLATFNNFTPAGAVSQMTYGNGLIETSAYNSRLQPTQLRTYNPTTNTDILNLSYGFTDSAGANNGNVVTFNSTANQIFMRSYTYDELNRLSTMSSPTDASGCYGLTWKYDAWGNRLSQNNGGGSCLSPSHGVMPNNRITDTGYNYDAAGNTVTDGSHGYTYDAENRLVSLDGGAATYTYDANGHRVQKITGGTTTNYLYDLSGNVVADVNGSNVLQAAYSYLGDSLFAEYAYDLTLFIHKDHLGSTRVMTNASGNVTNSMDYLPYGEMSSSAVMIPVTDPGFEGGPNYWSLGFWGCNSTVTTSQSHSGTSSLAQTGSVTGGSFQDVGGLTAGANYQVSVWVKADPGTTAQAELWAHDTNGGNSVTTALITPGTGWQQLSLTFTADSTNAIRIHLYYNAGSGTIYYDDVLVQQIGGSGGGTTHMFTGKEHDAESGLDDFGARYFSSSLGRFQTPDQPGADQQPDDPQSWNLYSYVRNNPTGNVDPSGRACVSGLNDSSKYCQRADLYGNLDALVHDKTRFFAAASAASQQIADVEMPIAGRLETSSTTRAFLESTGQALEKENIQVVGKILSGDIKAEGPQLDAEIVHKEQNVVQSQLDNFSKANPTDYKTAIKEINVLLNSNDSGGAVLKGLVGLSNAAGTTDKAYSAVLDEARKSRGHALDFSNQKDREAIGIALANHIRKTGGCDVAGNKIQGCK